MYVVCQGNTLSSEFELSELLIGSIVLSQFGNTFECLLSRTRVRVQACVYLALSALFECFVECEWVSCLQVCKAAVHRLSFSLVCSLPFSLSDGVSLSLSEFVFLWK